MNTTKRPKPLGMYFAGGAVIAFCFLGLAKTYDPKELERNEAQLQEAVDDAREELAAKERDKLLAKRLQANRLGKIASHTKLQLAEAH